MLRRYNIVEGRIADTNGDPGAIHVYVNPDENEKRHLIDTLKVDEHTLNSALDPDELSRLEFEPEHVALIFKRPKNYMPQDQIMFKVASTGLFLFKDRLIVVMADDVPLFDGKSFMRVSSLPSLMLRLIYRTIFHYLEHLKTINMVTDSLEQKVNVSMENRYLIHMFSLEKSLVYYLNAINSNAMVIEKLKNNAAKIGFNQENLEFLDDILIENSQCYKQADIYSNILANLMDARVSIVSNNLNLIMKTLTIITLAIMVPTLIVSAFSMNVAFPMQRMPNAFWIIMAMAIVSAVGVLFFWKYKKWW